MQLGHVKEILYKEVIEPYFVQFHGPKLPFQFLPFGSHWVEACYQSPQIAL